MAAMPRDARLIIVQAGTHPDVRIAKLVAHQFRFEKGAEAAKSALDVFGTEVSASRFAPTLQTFCNVRVFDLVLWLLFSSSAWIASTHEFGRGYCAERHLLAFGIDAA